MTKTYTYLIITICAYLFIVVGLNLKSNTSSKSSKKETKSDTKSGTGLSENADKNGVSRGASGQQKYRIGYTK